MSTFEFVFSLFGLLLGISLIEVLSGLARTVEAKLRLSRREEEEAAEIRVGWLTPLLGVFLMLDLISFWRAAWVARDHLPPSGAALFGGLVFAGSYYLAAHLVFPRDVGDEVDLDDHYFRVKRLVFGTLLALLALQMAFWFSVPQLASYFTIMPQLWVKLGVFVALLVGVLTVSGKRVNLALLVMLVGYYLVDYLRLA